MQSIEMQSNIDCLQETEVEMVIKSFGNHLQNDYRRSESGLNWGSRTWSSLSKGKAGKKKKVKEFILELVFI